MDLLKILEAAVRLEVESKALYLNGEQAATTQEARELLRWLAGQEEKHRLMVLDLYQKIAGKEFTEDNW